MIEKFRLWLAGWLFPNLIEQFVVINARLMEIETRVRSQYEYENIQVRRISELELANEQRLRELQELKTAMATFHVEQYRPPVALELAKKVIATKNMREYNLIRERELQEMEDA